MIDSHTHLQLCEGDEAEVVAAAERAGVSRLLNVGLDGDSCRAALAAADTFGGVWAAVGRHPNSATGFDDADLEELRTLAGHRRCAAVGETGLDFHRDHASRSDQERAFIGQIELARELGKPLIIHTRAAEERTLELLSERADGITVVLHCFSMPDRLDQCLEAGWTISYAGNVTFSSATALADSCVRVPADRLLVETDAPYLAPVPMRGRTNQPAFVMHTAQFVADRRGVSLADLEADVERNAARLFGW